MALEPGTSIGFYSVTAKIGEGGMGEVYRARDAKLDRDVALKVLPEAFTSDPDRLGRFEREAKVLASLNHPNIGGIHGLEDSGDIRALVLELVEGPTLADRIAQGAMPVEECLGVAKQIAEALEAAHEQGVVHRDLKPANIKIRTDGTVKVLDFGLAKAFQPDTGTADLADSPTMSLTAAATQMGMVIGTAAYMAPEQAKGKPVDKRADVWAFGAVLYEMLTGQKPFAGDDVSTTLARVIEREPDWDALPGDLPPVLASFLRRCLTKEPRQRLHDIADVRLALEGAFESDLAPVQAAAAPPARRWQRPLPLGVAALGLLVAGALTGASFLDGDIVSPSPIRFTLTIPAYDRMAALTGGTLAAMRSGDRAVIYVASRDGVNQLFRRPLDQFQATPIPDSTRAHSPVLSPDGQWLAFGRSDDTARVLAKVPLDGGPAQTLTTTSAFLRGIDWGDDGQLVYGLFRAGSSLMQIPAAGGEPTTLFTPDDERESWFPQVLTAHDTILFTLAARTPTALTGDLYLLDRTTGQHRLLLADALAGRVLDSGHLVFQRDDDLWAVGFDRDRLALAGSPVPVVEEVEQYALSDAGDLLYRSGGASQDRLLVWVDHDGQKEPLPAPPRSYNGPALSPDGDRAAVSFADDSGNVDVWVTELARGTLTRLTRDAGDDHSPLWTPDGRRVVFTGVRGDQPALFWTAADGTEPAEPLLTIDDADEIVASDWSRDGRTLFFDVSLPETDTDIGTMSLDAPGDWQPLLQTPAYEGFARLSPDGRSLAYASNDAGAIRIYLQRYPEMTDRRPVSQGRAIDPQWAGDGRELSYLDSPVGPPLAMDRVMIEVGQQETSRLRLGDAERLFDFIPAGFVSVRGSPSRRYDVSADGRFLTVKQATITGDTLNQGDIQVVLNWDEELKARVPVP